MRDQIKSWGRKLAYTFVRQGTNRSIVITNKNKNRVASVFVSFSSEGELIIQVNRTRSGEALREWRELLKINIDTGVE